jgi:hypothetical protein
VRPAPTHSESRGKRKIGADTQAQRFDEAREPFPWIDAQPGCARWRCHGDDFRFSLWRGQKRESNAPKRIVRRFGESGMQQCRCAEKAGISCAPAGFDKCKGLETGLKQNREASTEPTGSLLLVNFWM